MLYFLKSYLRMAVPRPMLRALLPRVMNELNRRSDKQYITDRANYYCRLTASTPIDRKEWLSESVEIGRQPKTRQKVYYFDAMEYGRWFRQSLRWILHPGDVNTIMPLPTIVKSRPIKGDNANNVLLNLNKVRHFLFVSDSMPWREKKDICLFRGKIAQHSATGNDVKPVRYNMVSRFFGNPLFDVGIIDKDIYPEWQTPKLTIKEQMQYKFVMSLEGNDVASNLKWIMSSNCVAVMPEPTCETWFMEGLLKPNYHYICVRPDFSDLEERLRYYLAHPNEAEAIIEHAHEWVAQFQDKQRERLISLLTLNKYLETTNK